jgi:hypothetical protein
MSEKSTMFWSNGPADFAQLDSRPAHAFILQRSFCAYSSRPDELGKQFHY